LPSCECEQLSYAPALSMLQNHAPWMPLVG
jgi:hypothetical protein